MAVLIVVEAESALVGDEVDELFKSENGAVETSDTTKVVKHEQEKQTEY